MFKILVPDAHSIDMAMERSVSGDRFEYIAFQESDPRQIPAQSWEISDGVLVRHHMQITDETVRSMNNCRIIVRAGFDALVRSCVVGQRGLVAVMAVGDVERLPR